MYMTQTPQRVETNKKNKEIERIAKETLNLETLETRWSDSLDFNEHSAWSIKAALEAAFDAGKKAAEKA